MNKKVLSPVLAILIFIGGGLTTRLYDRVKAEGWYGLVGSVNGTSPDADGNVNVTSVNGNTVNSSVPSNADFEQYEVNTTNLNSINTTLSNLTATAVNVEKGKSAVMAGGVKQNGLNRNLFARYDFNLDGNINSSDLELITDCITESITFDSVKKRFDLNLDGSVDITDMSILSSIIENYNGLEDPLGMSGYDIDGDGIINNDDYNALQDMVSGGTSAKVRQYLCSTGKLFDVDGNGSVTVSDIITLRDQLPTIKTQREALVGITDGVTAGASQVLEGGTFYGNNGYATGTMPNNGAVSETVDIGGSYTIPRGFHNGHGVITGPTLNGLTATPENVASGYTFVGSGGNILTGTMGDISISDISVTTGDTNSSASYDSGEKRSPTKIRVVEGSVVYQGHTMYMRMTFQGSDDNSTWVTLDEVTKSVPAWNNISSQLPVEFGIHSEYRYYRIVFSTWADGSQITIYAKPQFICAILS